MRTHKRTVHPNAVLDSVLTWATKKKKRERKKKKRRRRLLFSLSLSLSLSLYFPFFSFLFLSSLCVCTRIVHCWSTLHGLCLHSSRCCGGSSRFLVAKEKKRNFEFSPGWTTWLPSLLKAWRRRRRQRISGSECKTAMTESCTRMDTRRGAVE